MEDILLEIMQVDNSAILDNSKRFLSDNRLSDDRQKEFTCNTNEEKHKGTVKYNEKKSIISVAGQLQFSGMNNSVIIGRTDYIKREVLLTNRHCKNIKKLFLTK